MRRPSPIAVLVVLLAVGAGLAGPAPAQQPASVSEPEVHALAAQLRCVVCQNLSVADSPSEMAAEMRAVIRERLAAGEPPEQIIQYFVDKYGEWILLAPRREGFTLLVWVLPGAAVLVGLGLAGALLHRWTRRPGAPAAATAPVLDAATRERIRRELEAGS